MQVFISHSRKDRELALRLTRQLKDVGIDVWNFYDEVLPGDNWAEEMGRGLQSSDVMIVLFPQSADENPYLQQEVQFALTSGNYRGRVIPVLRGAKDRQKRTDVPWVLHRLEAVNLGDSPRDLSPVVRRVQAVAGAGLNAAN